MQGVNNLRYLYEDKPGIVFYYTGPSADPNFLNYEVTFLMFYENLGTDIAATFQEFRQNTPHTIDEITQDVLHNSGAGISFSKRNIF